MKLFTLNGQTVHRLRKNSDGTSLVQPHNLTSFAYNGDNAPTTLLLVGEQCLVSSKHLQPLHGPTKPRLTFLEPLERLKLDAFRGDGGCWARNEKGKPTYR